MFVWRPSPLKFTAICVMYTFALCLHRIISVFCQSRVHYAADQYSIGHLAWWRWKLLTLNIVLGHVTGQLWI